MFSSWCLLLQEPKQGWSFPQKLVTETIWRVIMPIWIVYMTYPEPVGCTNYLACSCASNVSGVNCLWFGWINSFAGWYLSDDSSSNLWLVTATNFWIVSTQVAWRWMLVSATIIDVLVNILSVSSTLWWLKPHHSRLGLPNNKWLQTAASVPWNNKIPGQHYQEVCSSGPKM